MAYERLGAKRLDYFPCRYGTSRLMFRGPRRQLDRNSVVVLGGSETYGRFVERPWPALVERALGVQVVNLGYMNAGLDAFLHDDALLTLCASARASVVQVTGAQNLTNRFYEVHPRRNDRFLRPHAALSALYRDIDFTEVHFTRHLMRTLQAQSRSRFAVVARELKAVCVARMTQLLERLPAPRLLLWIAEAPPAAAGTMDLGASPMLIDREMLAAAAQAAQGTIEAVISPQARRHGTDGMIFDPLEAPAASGLPGPAAHAEVARAMIAALRDRS